MPGKPKRREGRMFKKVHVCLYADEKFRELSKPNPNAQTLWIYLLTCPISWSVPGLIAIGEAALAESLGWPLAAFRKAFNELADAGMAVADWTARVIWLPHAIKYSEPENANVIRGWAKRIGDVPECDLKRKAIAETKAYLERLGEPFTQWLREGFAEPFGEPLPEPSDHGLSNGRGNGSDNGIGNGLGNQKHKHKQKQNDPPDPLASSARELYAKFPNYPALWSPGLESKFARLIAACPERAESLVRKALSQSPVPASPIDYAIKIASNQAADADSKPKASPPGAWADKPYLPG
jgi:hypothetical protein